MNSYTSAVFTNYLQAEGALTELRSKGVPDSHLSVISRQAEPETLTERVATEDVSTSATAGLVEGATVGAVLGLAAAFIPGVGPFIAAGSLVSLLGFTAGTAATGLIAGASVGTLGASLAQVGYNENEANFYSREIELGHLLVSINADEHVSLKSDELKAVLARHGGRSAETVAAI